MTLRGIRWCQVLAPDDAEALAALLDALGIDRHPLTEAATDGFAGAVFPAGGDTTWVEVWPAGGGMEVSTMLQLVVDDADEVAERARAAGYDPQGPTDAHDERLYFLAGPGGVLLSFQSPRQTTS